MDRFRQARLKRSGLWLMALAILSLLAANALHMPFRSMSTAAQTHSHHQDGPAQHDQATSGCHVCRLAGSFEVPAPPPGLADPLLQPERRPPAPLDDQWTDDSPLDHARPARGPPAA